MQIVVMSQSKAEEYAMQEHTEKSVIVSITCHCTFEAFIIPNRLNNIVDILRVQFEDTDSKEIEYGGITEHDAIIIRDFINKYKDNSNIDKIIVHCHAGQSRSAGVAAAIMKYLNNDDTPIFNNHKYTPNMLCYRRVLNAFME